jgi:hypothetical protein
MSDSRASIYDQLPTQRRAERDGRNVVERLAIAVVRREIAALPASLVVQLAFWPDEIAAWAREEHLAESLVYNTLAGRKPYARTRARLAERLSTSISVIDHLIEATRAQPTVRRGVDALLGEPASDLPASIGSIDWTQPPFARVRDGSNPIERRAVRAVEVDVASMPAASVVGLAIWPETLAAWSRAERLKSSMVWATLAGSPSGPVRDALARRLGVSLRELDALVTLERAVPVARRPASALRPPPASEPVPAGPSVPAPRPPSVSRTRNVPRPRGEQLGFDL